MEKINSLTYEQVLSKASKICTLHGCNKCKLRSVCLDYDFAPKDIVDFIERLKELI